jgi:hypothetical protein
MPGKFQMGRECQKRINIKIHVFAMCKNNFFWKKKQITESQNAQVSDSYIP